MGRKAKIRQQRKHESLKEEVSSLLQKPSPKKKSENKSFFGRIAASLNPFSKAEKYQSSIDAHGFVEENQVLVGAIAHEGYKQQGKGLVLVVNSDSETPQIEYIQRKSLKKSMSQYDVASEDVQAMDNMIQVYEPADSVVMAYVNNNGEISTAMIPQTDPSPEECYRKLQQKR
ncbi:MAG: hypothetical protein PUP93_12915 [Rhizonema sp. NSF051]|nr:hypothetical protein [Rhizonema sp. NSF051]